MATEIERKFLVEDTSWEPQVQATKRLKQGYLTGSQDPSVRIRISGARAFLTVKGGTNPLNRLEYEYEIPTADAETMLDDLCEKPLIEKTRYEVRTADGLLWEIDRFAGQLGGLVLAEVELPNDSVKFDLPCWIGREVTDDPQYLNANLQRRRPDAEMGARFESSSCSLARNTGQARQTPD